MSGALSGLFGGKPRKPLEPARATTVTQQPADVARDDLLKRLAKLRRATMTSQLSEPNVKRKVLGAA